MNLEPFFAKCEVLPEPDRRWAVAFCKTLDGVFDDECFEDLARVSTLFYGNGNGLSKAQYYRKRKLVVDFYQWLLEQNVVDEAFVAKICSLKLDDIVTDKELTTYYFASLDAALSFITQIGIMHGLGRPRDLLTIKSIAILSWYQFAPSDMVKMLKSDIDAEARTIHTRDGDAIILPSKYIDILQMFAETDVHKGFPNQKIQIFQPSFFLFRSSRQPQMTTNNIDCYLKRFNAETMGTQLLGLTALRKNGTMERIHNMENSGQTINSIVQSLIGSDRAMAFGYARFYRAWRAKFYPERSGSS